MEKDGEPLYVKFLDESDLHEEGEIQFKNERRFEIY